MSYADNPVLEVGKFVREHTSPNDPLLVFGDEWNSQLPYYSQRKAFVVPLFFKAYLRPLESPERYLDRGQSAILICDSEREDQALVKMVADDYPKWPKAALQKCDVYLRKN